MTHEERLQYYKEYRLAGFGRLADKRHRAKHLQVIKAKDAERQRQRRKQQRRAPN